jgi:hypothetical protein
MRIRNAHTRKDFEAVWKLTCDIYIAEGYANPSPIKILRHYPQLDLIPETIVLPVEDDYGNLLGSNSLTVDSPAGLHVDDDFKDVADYVRTEC